MHGLKIIDILDVFHSNSFPRQRLKTGYNFIVQLINHANAVYKDDLRRCQYPGLSFSTCVLDIETGLKRLTDFSDHSRSQIPVTDF